MLRWLFPVDQEDVNGALFKDSHDKCNESECENQAKDCIEDLVGSWPFVYRGQKYVSIRRHFEGDEPVGSNEEENPEHDSRPHIKEEVECSL